MRFKAFFITIIFILMGMSFRVAAQIDRQAAETLISDIGEYEKASILILREKRYDEGIEAITSLINQTENRASSSLAMLASYYRLRAQAQLRKGVYQDAADDCQHALTLLEKAGEEGREELPSTWNLLAVANYYLGRKTEVIHAADNYIATALAYYGDSHSETIDAYNTRSNYEGIYGMNKAALDDRRQILEIIRHNIVRNFTYLTASERTAYWDKYRSNTTVMFAFGHKMEEHQSTFTDALFDQQLLAKGLLLTAESALQRVIDSDENLKASYSKIRTLRLKASDPKASPTVAQQATLEADRLERLLGSSANALYQFMDFLNVSAADVKAKLSHNDVAVEFVDYRVGKDSTMYAALVMSPQWEHVLFLPLIEQRELSSSSDNLTSRIWVPILDTVGSNVENIFFSPTGLLYQLPIESHLLSDGRSMGEAYRLHRMSSTRWLAVDQDTTAGNNALVYGGLTYDATIEEMQEEAEQSSQSRIKGKQRNSSRGAGELIGLDYLPATKKEAEIITQTINEARKKNLHADILLGQSGTETSFKRLSGQNKQLVHIATHGFFNDNRPKGTDVLSQCGLYFAGADNKIQGEAIPEGIDDGVLTAEEISFLDLRGLDLITLSACQTGQGNITSDGVFGLQRSFKKAGANSILMSLWKVDDEATCLLMTEFYKNWISDGKSKIDALEMAKQTVRSHKEKGWDDPKYWAAFILLDAI